MQEKKTQVIPPKKSDAKKNKLAATKSNPDKKITTRKKLNEFGDNDSL